MNILSYDDAEIYLSYQQVYFKKGIVTVDIKTVAESNRVYDIGNVEIKRIDEDRIYFLIVINDIKTTITLYKTDMEFYAWIKVNFIPVVELIENIF